MVILLMLRFYFFKQSADLADLGIEEVSVSSSDYSVLPKASSKMAKVDTVLVLFLFGFLLVESLRIDPPKIRGSGKFFSVSDLPNFTPNDPRCLRDGLFPNPLDCTSYFACKDRQGQDRECPEGMKFHPIKHCTLDDDVECNRQASPMKGDENIECPDDYGMYVYPQDCHKYIFCLDRIPEVLECPGKQVYQNNVGCVEGKECPKVQSSFQGSEQREKCLLPPDFGPCKAKILRYYYDINNGQCNKFFYGGCQGNDNNFDTKLKCELICSFPQPEDGIGVCKSHNGIYHDRDSCKRYIKCVDFIPNLITCPEGEGFSSKTRRCVNLKESDCKSNSVVDIMDI